MLTQGMAIKSKRYLACLAGLFGGVFAGIGLSQGGVCFTLLATFLLWSSKEFPLASFLWGGAAVLLSHSWLIALHPLTWIGVPESFSLPITISIWICCGIFGGILVGGWSLIGQITSFDKLTNRNLKNEFSYAFALSLIWGIGEVLLAKSPLFWVGLGSSFLPDDRYMAGLARWIGAGGLASAQLLIGWWLWKTSCLIRNRVSWVRFFSYGLLVVFACHCLGIILLSQDYGSAVNRVAIWQTNIPTREKFSENHMAALSTTIRDALDKAQKLNAEWMVAPEGTIPNDQIISPASIRFLVGGFRWVGNEQRSSLLAFEKGSTSYSKAIDKNRLVPLGEWIPSLEWLKFKGLSFVGGLQPGNASRLFLWKGIPPVSVAICYEISDGNALSKASLDGAEWILSIANLDPYPISLQRQYLALAQLRSIESARELISVANTGPTSIISSTGKIDLLIPPFKEGVRAVDLHLSNNISGYSRFGELPLILGLIINFCFFRKLK